MRPRMVTATASVPDSEIVQISIPPLFAAPLPQYKVVVLPGHDLAKVDFLTVNGIRFVRAGEDITVVGGGFAIAMAALILAATVVGVITGSWLFHCLTGKGLTDEQEDR